MHASRPSRSALALRVVLPCLVAQNVAFGLTYGSYGTLIAANQATFHVSRATASTGAGLFNLAIGLAAPVLGGAMQRLGVRRMMIAAALLCTACHVAIALAPRFAVVLAAYALLGISSAALGVLGPIAVIGRWFVAGRARVLGVVNLPILMLLTPFAVATLLPMGRTLAGLAVAAASLIALPALLALSERPPTPASAAPGTPGAPAATEPPARAILTRADFWLLSVGVGLLAGASGMFVVHIAPIGASRGLAPAAAAGLVSAFAAAGLVGAPLMGWAADRLGAPATLVLATLVQTLLWAALLWANGAALFGVAGLMGIVLVPVVVLHGAAMSQLIPVAGVPRALGLSYLIKLPFIFALPPLAGALADLTGTYRAAVLVFAAIAALACALFLVLRIVERRGHRTHGSPRCH